MIKPQNANEEVADARIVSNGIPCLDEKYPNWHSTVYHSAKRIADPSCCILVALETQKRTGSPYLHIKIGEQAPKMLSFHEVLKLHNMTIDDAIACGFAKSPSDPPTFYAALRDRWRAHTRHVVEDLLHLEVA